jgi:hypothetical protein
MFSWLLLAGCRPDLTPTYAYDPIWLEPAEEGGIHGFQTWQIYGPDWPDSYADKHYVCSVLVELVGLPTECDADEDCTFAWETLPEVRETDCEAPDFAQGELFLSLLRVGLGGPAAGEGVPWPDLTSVGWADYGNGWEIHGNAYPAALDDGAKVDSREWDEQEPFLMVPAQSFPL